MRFRRGDTIVEVTLAITIFSMVAMAGVTLMNMGVSNAQASLQLVMAREAMDAQAEALRMIHNSYAANIKSVEANSIASRWTAIEGKAVANIPKFGNGSTCQQMISDSTNRFVIDVRNLKNGTSVNPVKTSINNPSTFPRLFYGVEDSNNIDTSTSFQSAEGLWVQAVKAVKDPKTGAYLAYDFHIRTCWNAPGKNVPTTLGTIVRLYNPEKTASAVQGGV